MSREQVQQAVVLAWSESRFESYSEYLVFFQLLMNFLKPLTLSGTTLTLLPVKSCLQVNERVFCAKLLNQQYLCNSCLFSDQ